MDTQETQQPSPPAPLPEKKKLPLPLAGIIAGIVVVILLALSGVLVGVSMLRKPAVVPKTYLTPTPRPLPTSKVITPNVNPKFASDSAFLKIKEDLKALNQEISATNFFESEISSPNIDLKLEIK